MKVQGYIEMVASNPEKAGILPTRDLVISQGLSDASLFFFQLDKWVLGPCNWVGLRCSRHELSCESNKQIYGSHPKNACFRVDTQKRLKVKKKLHTTAFYKLMKTGRTHQQNCWTTVGFQNCKQISQRCLGISSIIASQSSTTLTQGLRKLRKCRLRLVVENSQEEIFQPNHKICTCS